MMKQYNVYGMSCAACQARVEKAVKSVTGVKSCSVSLLTNSMSVDGNASDEAIIKAVFDAGYSADIQNEISLEDKETPILMRRLILSAVILAALMFHGMNYPPSLADPLLSAAVLFINRKFFISGIKSVLHGAPNMDTLVAMGSGVSYLWSVYALVCGREDLYFDSAAMILTLITVGKWLESKARGRTTNAIKSLLEIAPDNAEGIKVGDEFSVHPGMKFPVDGVVISGTAKADESALTGESEPVIKKVGDSVYAATINMGSTVVCRATEVGDDTNFAHIVQMVSEAAESKAPIAKTADRVSAVFVPAVIAVAVVTFIIWMLTGSAVTYALERAISVLVISCPCSLGLATPVAIMVGNGIGARNGILFKNATALEQTGKTEIVVLDKTGTITTGEVGSDVARAESRSAIEELKKMGLRVIMLSGDKPERAKMIADQVGIDEVISGVLPDGKGDAINKLKAEGRVAMVGDGINDAIALTNADVGIAIGAGTDVAIDSADIVLMKSRLVGVAASIRLSRATMRNIKQNLFWAFFYNALCIPLAAGCYAGTLGLEVTPMIAAAAMSLSSFCVVVNALRLNLFKINDESVTDNRNSVAEENVMTKTINVEGMMCPHCEARVRKAIEAIDGVESAEVSHTSGTAVVALSQEVSDEVLKQAIEDQDYQVTGIR